MAGKDPNEAYAHDPKRCEELLKQMREKTQRNKRDDSNKDPNGKSKGGTHGLAHRYDEQRKGKYGPGDVKMGSKLIGDKGDQKRVFHNTEPFKTHDEQYKGQQSGDKNGLQKDIKEWDNRRCGKLPKSIRQWGWKKAPKTNDQAARRAIMTAARAAKLARLGFRLVRIGSLFTPVGLATNVGLYLVFGI
ncbi:MAG: hypothetical protein KC731_20845 [Myxococcales bacterium]|nr:hypothetical protein [Myxococcales bacterium]MCA9627531.1 hypothetical protein [Myxococcales bacterium]